MTKKERIIVGKILCVASDKRHRVDVFDENEWLEEKMKEIKRLAKSLLPVLSDGTGGGEYLNKGN